MTQAEKSGRFAIDDCVMVDAKVLRLGHYIFVAHSEAALKKNTYVCQLVEYRDGTWSGLAEWAWQAVALALSSAAPLQAEVLGRDGQVATYAGNNATETQLDPPRAVGPFRGIRYLPMGLLAFGMKREVYRRDGGGNWTSMMQGLVAPLPDRPLTTKEKVKLRLANVGGLNAIEVDAGEGLVAFGMDGEIWHYVAGTWTKGDSPTNLILTAATRGPDERIFVCGQVGTILSGSGSNWEVLSYVGPQGLDFVSIASFSGSIFVADGHSLRVLVDGELRLVDFGVEDIVPCAVVTAGPGCMLSVAGQEVWESSDGRAWNSILG